MTIEIEDALARELYYIATRIECSVAGDICLKNEPIYVKKLKVRFVEYLALTETTEAIRKEIYKATLPENDLPF